jgi:hypothetical protein
LSTRWLIFRLSDQAGLKELTSALSLSPGVRSFKARKL